MQIFLIRETKGNAVHATDTKKRTGCGINLQKPENMTKYTVSGTVDDAFGLMTEVTCEKCQTVFTKRVLKADRKEMDRMLKEEKKRAKLQGEDPNLVSLAEVQQERQKQAQREARSAARAARREEEEAAARAAAAEKAAAEQAEAERLAAQQAEAEQNAPLDVPSVPEVPEIPDESPVPEFTQYIPPAKKAEPAPTHTSYGGFALDADLAQFAVPKASVDPTAAAFAANEGKNPNILAQQQEAAKPILDDPADIMAQFAIPGTAPAAPAVQESAPAVSDMDDLMAQFGIPGTAPAAPEVQESTPAVSDMDDLMAQFGITGTQPAPAVPEVQETAPETPVMSDMDDLMAQFGITGAQPAPAVPEVQETAPEAPVMNDMDDLMAQFGITGTQPAPAVPEVQETAPEAPVMDDMDDLMAQFAIPEAQPVQEDVIETVAVEAEEPLTDSILEFDMIADRMFGGSAEPVVSVQADVVDTASAFEALTSPVDEFNSTVAQMSAAAAATQEIPAAEETVAEEVVEEITEPAFTTPEFAAPEFTIPAEELIPAEPVIPVIEPENITVPDLEPVSEAPEVPEVPAFTAPAVSEVPEVPEVPAFTAPAVSEVPEVPEVPAFTAPAVSEVSEVPEVPAFTAPAVSEVPEVPEVPAFTAPAAAEVPEVPEVPAAAETPAAPEIPAQPAVNMAAPQQFMQQAMPQNVQAMPNMQQPVQAVPQFMGYDAQGQPVYAYVQPMMPQFMGYDAQGQPVYAQVAPQPYAPQQAAPQQMAAPQAAPVAPAAPQAAPAPAEQPAPAPQKKRPLISPMTAENAVVEKLSLPEDTERPAVEPMTFAKPKKSQGVRVSKIQQKDDMPDIVRSAISKSAAPQGNIFDQQNADVAVTDSIDDLLSMMGEDTSKYRKKEDNVNLEYREYKPKTKKTSAPKPAETEKAEEPARPLTKEELKRQKREAKINAKFQKDLAKRGF